MALGGLSESEVAERIGKSVSYVSNMLVLVGSAPEIQQMVKSGEVKATVAVQTIRSEGDAATETLKEAVTIAKSEGKKKATSKQVAKATYARKDPNAQSIQDRVKALRAMPAVDALEKFEKLVKPKALVFEALLKSALPPTTGQEQLVAALRGLLAECALEPDHPAVVTAWEALKAVEGQ
jgi:ParB-like chromosome segregation protein Spo0J